MAKQIFYVPLSQETAATVHALQTAATQQGLNLSVIETAATDHLLSETNADVAIIKLIDTEHFTPSLHNVVVAVPASSDSILSYFADLHPDMTRVWCSIHASNALANMLWLKDTGASLQASHALTLGNQTVAVTAAQSTGAPELSLYGDLSLEKDAIYDITAQTLAHSENYSPDADGWQDLSGRATHAVFGPYHFLPPGLWGLDIEIEVDCEDGTLRLFFEWGPASGGRTNFESVIRQSGRYAIRLQSDFPRIDASHCLIATNASHLQGRMRVTKIELQRLTDAANTKLSGWA